MCLPFWEEELKVIKACRGSWYLRWDRRGLKEGLVSEGYQSPKSVEGDVEGKSQFWQSGEERPREEENVIMVSFKPTFPLALCTYIYMLEVERKL